MNARTQTTNLQLVQSYTPMQQGILQRMCNCGQKSIASGECSGCRKKRRVLQHQRVHPHKVNTVPSVVHEVLRSPGQPIDMATLSCMESRFGYDFSQVRVHTDNKASESARELNAKAYTIGQDVAFRQGAYAPGTGVGRKLIAHELTHVVQQQNTSGLKYRNTCENNDSHEREAQQVAERITSGNSQSGVSKTAGMTLMREGGPNPIWGGFRITGGNDEYIRAVRADLDRLNSTSTGSRLLREIETNRSGLLSPLITIDSSGACGYLPRGRIFYNATGCNVRNTCRTHGRDWTAVPNYIYLYHEIVHAYLEYIASRETHPERECMTTGLGRYAAEMPYNENRLRCELGLPVRPCYDGECREFAAPTCERIAVAEREEAEARGQAQRELDRAQYLEQLQCVIRLGGCPGTRPGGLPSVEELRRYNDECRSESDYHGAQITPSDEECRGHGS